MKNFIKMIMLFSIFTSFGQIDSTYYQNSIKVLEKFPNSKISAEDLFYSAKIVYERDSLIVPIELVVSQAIIETSLGNTGVGKSRNNPYSINSKRGYIIYPSIREGVLAYYKLISKNYLRCRSVDKLLNNFINCKGYRYASSKTYEFALTKQINRIRKILEQ